MESNNKPVLKLRREFGDITGDAQKFMKVNFKPMITVFLTYVVPIFILPFIIIFALGYMPGFLKSLSMNPLLMIGTGMMSSSVVESLIGLLFFLFFMFIGYMILNLTLFGTFLAFEENGNEKVTVRQIKTNIKQKFLNYFVSLLVLIPMWVTLYLVFLFMMGICVSAGAAPTFIVFFMWLFFFTWLLVQMINFSWIRIREDVGVVEGFSRSFALNKGSWWSMFGSVFVAYIVVLIICSFFYLPFQLLTYFLVMSGIDISESSTLIMLGSGFSFLIYIIGTAYVQQFISASAIFKYYDKVVQKDGSLVLAQIEELGTESERFFENEGDY